jgi:MoxR-like ATPase
MTDPHQTALHLTEQLARAVLGKSFAVELTVAALLAGGHVLLEDLPGVGKTLLAKSLAQSFQGTFRRVQFTSDMMPADITGTSVFNLKTHEFEFIPGPVFTHILLADEINRATPRSQSSLLEVMEERQVTVDGKTHLLEQPFFVIATQNPLESYGTFPLPESQLDRFMLSLSMGYPDFEQELKILALHQAQSAQKQTRSLHEQLEAMISAETIRHLQQQVTQIEVSDEIRICLLKVVQQTRQDTRLVVGGSTRAAVAFLRLAQAWAFLKGRRYVIPDDIRELAPFVLAHRVVTRQHLGRADKQALIAELAHQAFQGLKL